MERVLQTRQYVFTITWDEEARVWVTFVPDLNNLSTFGETRAEAIAHTHEAIESYLEAAETSCEKIGQPLIMHKCDSRERKTGAT